MNEQRDTPGVIAPPPLIALAVLVFGLLFDWLLPAYVLATFIAFWTRIAIGVALMAAGLTLAFVARTRFVRAGTNVEPWKPSLNLVTGGIFGWLRNPMYVGLTILLAGLAIALASDWMLVLLVAAALTMHFGVVLREERYLEKKFGETYRAYKNKVPRYGWPD
ncbi:MAG: isoprenylcysteine carboxylmethyltransferase family protein [Rhizobiales bacterium]|nr:isoprenylcysteine carboxylmethyltransferase family protein [Hyphomicrobiales bacterium]